MSTAMMPSPTMPKYQYRVEWSADDGEYVGTCAEFHSLSWLAEQEQEAFDGIRKLVRDVVAEIRASGEVVPEPLSARRFSGRFNLRTGSDLHRELVHEAEENGLSLNQYVLFVLASRRNLPPDATTAARRQ